MAAGGQAATARPFNPNFQHSDRERWICIYPAYINSKKTIAEGRRIPKNKAVDNPTPAEIKDVLLQTGLCLGIENKVYPRELDRNARGRIRVQLKNDDGTPVVPQFGSRQVLLEYIGETIPKLKTRSQGTVVQQQTNAGSGGAGGGGGGKKNKGKKK